jgi:hypothetical protein
VTGEKRYLCANPKCERTVSAYAREVHGPLCVACDITFHEVHDGIIYRRVMVEVGPVRSDEHEGDS